jgi:hypothetical protein
VDEKTHPSFTRIIIPCWIPKETSRGQEPLGWEEIRGMEKVLPRLQDTRRSAGGHPQAGLSTGFWVAACWASTESKDDCISSYLRWSDFP